MAPHHSFRVKFPPGLSPVRPHLCASCEMLSALLLLAEPIVVMGLHGNAWEPMAASGVVKACE